MCRSCQHIPAIASSCPHWNQMSCNNTVDCNKQETTPVCNGPPQAIMRLAGTMVALMWNQFSLNRLCDVVETALCIYYTLIILLTVRPGNRGESRFYVTGVQERLLLQIVRLHLYDVALIADASSLAWKPWRPAEVSKEMPRCRSQYLKSWSCRTPECNLGRMCFM